MAETTNHPQTPPDAIMSQEAFTAQTQAPSVTYQPLSLLAMAGFGLAVFYALAVLVGGAVSLAAHIPWLMPYWTFLVPVAALVICWAARTRILDSEGTLSGLAFTTWGSRLAIVLGITYAAYYVATFLAVRSPAIDVANDFFQKIKNGQLEQAFMMSQDVNTKNMSSEAMRDQIQGRFNQPMGGASAAPGTFSRFCQEKFVRFLQMDGERASTVPTGVSVWEYTKDGYHVSLSYHVTTSLVEFDMKVETYGRDPKRGESKGRQWSILVTRGETSVVPDSLKETPQGKIFVQRSQKAHLFAQEWAARVSNADALQPAERDSFSKLIRGYDTLWTGKEQREEIIKRIRNSFQPSGGKGSLFNMITQLGGIPLLRESDGRTTAWFDVTMRYYDDPAMMPHYLVEAELVLSAQSSAAAESAAAWRVEAIELRSARTAPEMRRMQQRLGGANAEGAGPGGGGGPPNPPPPPPTNPGAVPQRRP